MDLRLPLVPGVGGSTARRKGVALNKAGLLAAIAISIGAFAAWAPAAQAAFLAREGIGLSASDPSSAGDPVPAVAISAGNSHTCALLADGGIRCWGENSGGGLGDGTTVDRWTPVDVVGITTATAIAAGGGFTCALLPPGTVECWGSNDEGELGRGTATTLPTPSPQPVIGISTATALASAGNHACALLAGGGVRCWGENNAGELGDGTKVDRWTPVAVSGITTAVAIAAGSEHTCAVLAEGTIRCWGQNGTGQLGDGTTTDRTTPISVSGITTAVSIATGHDHTCAVLADDQVECWGDNFYGQVGEGTQAQHWLPFVVPGVASATVGAGDAFSCALLVDAGVACWGENEHGELGLGSFGGWGLPGAVPGVTSARAVAIGSVHACVLLVGGSVTCWGSNWAGQLGNGATADASGPVDVVGLGSRPPDSIAITPANPSVPSGDQLAFTATATYDDLDTADVTLVVSWTSGSPAVATIGASGVIHGAMTGGTTITATLGSVSASTNITVTPVLPGAPLSPEAVGEDAQVSVSWEPPTSDGGVAITGYVVTSSPDSKTCSTTGALLCSVTGLANGTPYTFTVVATNGVGSGPASSPSVPVSPLAAPSAPTAVSATPSDSSALVSWEPPTSDGGVAITGYVVTSSPDSKTCSTTGALLCSVTGLANGTPYTFTVVATNGVGSGPASSPSVPVSPLAAPSAPTAVSATPSDSSALVSWEPPTSDGGVAITGYVVTSSPDSKTCSTTGALLCSVTGLANGTPYTFTVVATNGVGSGPASSPSTAVTPSVSPLVPPTAAMSAQPTFLTTGAVQVQWSATPGTSPVSSYNVRYRRAAWNGTFGGYATWLSATQATSATYNAPSGYTYCFSAQARDTLDALSMWTAETCTAIPLDDRSLTRSGSWTSGTGSGYYRSTYRRSASYGAKLTRTHVVAKRIALLAKTCSTCGSVKVYWGSTLIKTINLYSRTTVKKKLLTVKTFTSGRSGTLSIRISSHGKKVIIDGLAVRRN